MSNQTSTMIDRCDWVLVKVPKVYAHRRLIVDH